MNDLTPTGNVPAVTLRLVYHLGEILEAHGITWYRLSKVSGMSDNTIKALCETQLDRLNVSNLERLVNALRQLTGEEINVADVFTVEQTPPASAPLAPTPVTAAPLPVSAPTPSAEPEAESLPRPLWNAARYGLGKSTREIGAKLGKNHSVIVRATDETAWEKLSKSERETQTEQAAAYF